MPTDSCHFPCTSDTLVRPQNSLARKVLSATRGLARGGVRHSPANPQFFFLQIFLGFCRFSLFLRITAFWRRRFSQETAGNHRFSQKPDCPIQFVPFIGFGKRGLLEKGSFQKVHLLEIPENLEILEILENPQTVERKGECDHVLEILENLEILDILEIPAVKRPLS